jgi:pimeloyl-ACP methyl ester carboxylesterase
MGGLPRARWGIVACALVALLLAFARPAHAQFVLQDAYPAAKMAGPGRALGAVIWNHGKPPFRGADGDMLPFYLDRLREAGWDVFRLERDWSSDNLALSPAALREHVGAVYERGYRKVVLAGQSYGAWISLLVAASGPPIHAVIATAPAAFGRYPDSRIFHRNADELYPILERIRDTRVMMFLFQGDAYDTGDRGAPAREILADNAVDNAVIAYPTGWIGHGAANWNGFATRFAPCIARFIDPKRATGDAHCERDPVTRDALTLALPDEAAPARSVSSAPPSGPFGGLWYGVYTNGREALLSLDPIQGGTVTGVYAWGIQQRDEVGAPGYDHRVGRVQGERLMFTEPDRPRIEVQPLGPDRISLTWTSSDGTRTDTAELHRLR